MKPDKFEQGIEDNIGAFKPVSADERRQISAIIRKAKEKKSVS